MEVVRTDNSVLSRCPTLLAIHAPDPIFFLFLIYWKTKTNNLALVMHTVPITDVSSLTWRRQFFFKLQQAWKCGIFGWLRPERSVKCFLTRLGSEEIRVLAHFCCCTAKFDSSAHPPSPLSVQCRIRFRIRRFRCCGRCCSSSQPCVRRWFASRLMFTHLMQFGWNQSLVEINFWSIEIWLCVRPYWLQFRQPMGQNQSKCCNYCSTLNICRHAATV